MSACGEDIATKAKEITPKRQVSQKVLYNEAKKSSNKLSTFIAPSFDEIVTNNVKLTLSTCL